MDPDICIGIFTKRNVLELAAIEHDKTVAGVTFPDTRMGREAIKGFLVSREPSFVRLAVAGTAALSVALALGNAPGREAFIVSSTVADQAVALAHYAEHAI